MNLKLLLFGLLASYSPNPSMDQIAAEYGLISKPKISHESYEEEKERVQKELDVCKNMQGKEILGFYIKNKQHHVTISLDKKEYGYNTTMLDLILERIYSDASIKAEVKGYKIVFNTKDKNPENRLIIDVNVLCYGLEQANPMVLKKN